MKLSVGNNFSKKKKNDKQLKIKSENNQIIETTINYTLTLPLWIMLQKQAVPSLKVICK
jgi:hypothetical protein